MILNETNLKLKFESIFDGDPNFASESQGTKDWAFRAFVAAHSDDLGIYFVKTMNERLFKNIDDDVDLSSYPSFELAYDNNNVIKFCGVVVWNEDDDGMLCDDDVIDGIKKKVRKILVFLNEQM